MIKHLINTFLALLFFLIALLMLALEVKASTLNCQAPLLEYRGQCMTSCQVLKSQNAKRQFTWSQTAYGVWEGNGTLTTCKGTPEQSCSLIAESHIFTSNSAQTELARFAFTGDSCPFRDNGEFFGAVVPTCEDKPDFIGCRRLTPDIPDTGDGGSFPNYVVFCKLGDNGVGPCPTNLSSDVNRLARESVNHFAKNAQTAISNHAELNREIEKLKTQIVNGSTDTAYHVSGVTKEVLHNRMTINNNASVLDFAKNKLIGMNSAIQNLKLSDGATVDLQPVIVKLEENLKWIRKGEDNASDAEREAKRAYRKIVETRKNVRELDEKLERQLRFIQDGVRYNSNDISTNNDQLYSIEQKLDTLLSGDGNSDGGTGTDLTGVLSGLASIGSKLDSLGSGTHTPTSNLSFGSGWLISDAQRQGLESEIEGLKAQYHSEVNEFKQFFNITDEFNEGEKKDLSFDLTIQGEKVSVGFFALTEWEKHSALIGAIIIFLAVVAGIKALRA